jgi:hypothetical protein
LTTSTPASVQALRCHGVVTRTVGRDDQQALRAAEQIAVGVIFLGKLVARGPDLKRVRAGEHWCGHVVRAVVFQLVETDIAAAAEDFDEIGVRQIFYVEHALHVCHRRKPLVSSSRFFL